MDNDLVPDAATNGMTHYMKLKRKGAFQKYLRREEKLSKTPISQSCEDLPTVKPKSKKTMRKRAGTTTEEYKLTKSSTLPSLPYPSRKGPLYVAEW
ncbi:hypothetical protein QOT17_011936 [Balamuthia mandrillaris]